MWVISLWIKLGKFDGNTLRTYFNEAIELAISDKTKLSWRAAWVLQSCVSENDTRLKAHVRSIINVLLTKKDGHQRELLKTLLQVELDEEDEAMLFDVCVRLWERINKSPSVRHTALMFILKTAKKYPDLIQEIEFLLQEQYLETLSPAIRRSVYRIRKELITNKY